MNFKTVYLNNKKYSIPIVNHSCKHLSYIYFEMENETVKKTHKGSLEKFYNFLTSDISLHTYIPIKNTTTSTNSPNFKDMNSNGNYLCITEEGDDDIYCNSFNNLSRQKCEDTCNKLNYCGGFVYNTSGCSFRNIYATDPSSWTHLPSNFLYFKPTPAPSPSSSTDISAILSVVDLSDISNYSFRFILPDRKFEALSNVLIKCKKIHYKTDATPAYDCQNNDKLPYNIFGNIRYSIMGAFKKDTKSKKMIPVEPSMIYLSIGVSPLPYEQCGFFYNDFYEVGTNSYKVSLDASNVIDSSLVRVNPICNTPIGPNGYITSISNNNISYHQWGNAQRWYVHQQMMIRGYIIIYFYPMGDNFTYNLFYFQSKYLDSNKTLANKESLWDISNTTTNSNIKIILKHTWQKSVQYIKKHNPSKRQDASKAPFTVGGWSQGAHATSSLMHWVNVDQSLAFIKNNGNIRGAWLSNGGSMNCFCQETSNNINDLNCPPYFAHEPGDINSNCCPVNTKTGKPYTEPWYDNPANKKSHPPVVITSVVDEDYNYKYAQWTNLTYNTSDLTKEDFPPKSLGYTSKYTIEWKNKVISLPLGLQYWNGLDPSVQNKSVLLIDSKTYWPTTAYIYSESANLHKYLKHPVFSRQPYFSWYNDLSNYTFYSQASKTPTILQQKEIPSSTHGYNTFNMANHVVDFFVNKVPNITPTPTPAPATPTPAPATPTPAPATPTPAPATPTPAILNNYTHYPYHNVWDDKDEGGRHAGATCLEQDCAGTPKESVSSCAHKCSATPHCTAFVYGRQYPNIGDTCPAPSPSYNCGLRTGPIYFLSGDVLACRPNGSSQKHTCSPSVCSNYGSYDTWVKKVKKS